LPESAIAFRQALRKNAAVDGFSGNFSYTLTILASTGQGGSMIRAIVSIAILLSGNAYLQAQSNCTRPMLMAAAESYIAAQKAGDPSKMSLAPKAKYQENMSVVEKEKGLWNTPLPIALHRSIYDVERCKTFSEVIVTEGGHPYVIGTRLTVNNGNITEIDSLVTDEGDWLFNAQDYLKYSSAEDWSVLPPKARVGRQQLIDAGNQYFDMVFNDDYIRPPWGSPCARLEGGAYTNKEKKNEDTCQVKKAIEPHIFIVNRTFVVDDEMGVVNVFCRFGDSNGMPDSHMFRLVNGKYRSIHTLSVNLSGKPVELPKAEQKQ
jgi:hypothetical protein